MASARLSQLLASSINRPCPGPVSRVKSRHLAAQKAGMVALAVIVHHGTRKDAIAYAIKSNSTHGLARSNADKRRAVCLALQEFSNRSDRALAEMCKTSQPFVSSIRRELKTAIASGKRVGRDGKQRSMPARRARKVPTDEQAIQPGSITEPDAASDHGGQDNVEFRVGESWGRIESFLLAELAKWPEHIRQHLQVQLREFTHRSS